jgi:hypothetical protein
MTVTDEAAARAAWGNIAHDIGAASPEAGLRWLAAQDDEWLLVLDNADDPSLDLAGWIPTCSHGNVIITTRNPECRLHAPGHSIELGAMDHEEARHLLLSLSGAVVNENSEQLASTIVEKLGCLALAVAHAGSFIALSSTLEGFLSLYVQHRARLLDHSPRQNTGYAWSVFTTWEMNYQQLDATAQYMINLSSFLHFAHIQWDIFRRAFARMPAEEVGSISQGFRDFFASFADDHHEWDEFRFHAVITQLRTFSMINRLSPDSHSLHPLVHAWAADRMSEEDRAQGRAASLVLLSLSIDDGQGEADVEYRTTLQDHCAALQVPEARLTAAQAEALAGVSRLLAP